MSKFGKLILNEWVKLFARPTIYIMLVLIPLVTIGYGVILKTNQNSYSYHSLTPEQIMREHINMLSSQIQTNQFSSEQEKAYAELELSMLQYAGDNAYDPTSWKLEALYLAIDEKLQAEQSDDATAATRYKALIKAVETDDIAAYFALERAGLEQELAAAEDITETAQVKARLDTLALRTKANIAPYFANWSYRETAQQWRNEALDTYSSCKESLYSGMGENGALSDQERQMLEENVSLLTYRIENDVAPVSNESQLGFLFSTASLIPMISLFLIIIAASMVASEYTSGTIKLLLISPHKRWKLFAAKLCTIFLVAVGMLALLFLSGLVTGGALYGFDMAGGMLAQSGGQITRLSGWLACLVKYLLVFPELLVMTALSTMLAVLMRRSAVAIGVGTAFVFSGEMIKLILTLLPYDFKRFVLFLNTDLSVYFPSLSIGENSLLVQSNIPEGMSFAFSLAVLFVYFICFGYIALDSFNRRDIKQA